MASIDQDIRPIPVPEMPRAELQRRLGDAGLVVLNALGREAYSAGHIPGSLSLPLAEVRERARYLLPDMKQEIVVYCGGPT